MSVSIRRATPEDAGFVADLLLHPEVRPYLAAGREISRETVAAEIERSQAEPDALGRFLIEVDGEPAGSLSFERKNERSRIAHLGGLAVHPDFRGRRVADEASRLFRDHLLFGLGYHRLELEIYGFNERSIAHADRVGWVREGVKRTAYRHGEGWADGVLYAIVREDLPGLSLLHDHVERFNAGVRTGDFESMLERFADDAELEFEGAAVGPFRGRDAIAAAYAAQPPDDEIEILDAHEDGDVVEAGYAWSRGSAGELRIERDGDTIRRLCVKITA